MGIKFPTPWKTLMIKFPPPRDSKGVKCPGYARGGACWSFDLTDTLVNMECQLNNHVFSSIFIFITQYSLQGSSPVVFRSTGVGKGRGEGELTLVSHKFEYLCPKMGCELLIGWFLIWRWRYVLLGELACMLTGQTTSSVLNFWKPFKYCSNEKFSFRDLTL